MRMRQHISSAPRDGTLIIVGHEDVGEFPVRWDEDRVNPFVDNYPGMWVMFDGSMTWKDCRIDGPDYWRPA